MSGAPPSPGPHRPPARFFLPPRQDWDPEGEQESFYTDGLHHTAEGQAALLACLRQQVEPLLQAAANQTAAAV